MEACKAATLRMRSTTALLICLDVFPDIENFLHSAIPKLQRVTVFMELA